MRRAKLIAAIVGRLLLIVGAAAHYFGRDYAAPAVLLLMLVALELVDVERALRTPRLAIRRQPPAPRGMPDCVHQWRTSRALLDGDQVKCTQCGARQ